MSLWFKLWSLFYDPILSQWIMAFRVILDDLWMIYVWLNWIYDLRNLRNLRPKHLLCAKAFPVIFISLIFQEFHLPPNVPLMSDFHHVFPRFFSSKTCHEAPNARRCGDPSDDHADPHWRPPRNDTAPSAHHLDRSKKLKIICLKYGE